MQRVGVGILLQTLVCALSWGIILTGSAVAVNFGSEAGGVYLAEDSTPLIARLNLTNGYVNAVNAVSTNIYNPTDLNGTVQGDQTNCADSLGHDVCAFDDPYGLTGWLGLMDCVGTVTGAHPDARCSRNRVRFNLSYADAVNFPLSLACEEMGHAVGLRHDFSGAYTTCMIRPVNTLYTWWSPHDIAHVNAHY